MMKSLFAGISGLRASQTRMDVIGNNVANVSTIGFKAGRVQFQDSFSQMLQSASRSTTARGGTNPKQVGLGVEIGSIDTIFTQGSMESTGVATDLAISGSSFFVVGSGNERFYTRAGNFQLDSTGRLVNPDGLTLRGRMASQGTFTGGVQDIVLPFDQKAPAVATSNVDLGGNLNAAAPVFTGTISTAADRDNPINQGAWTESTITVYDSQGAKHDLKIWAYKTSTNNWNWEIDPSGLGAAAAPAPTGAGTLTFGPDGLLTGPSTGTVTFTPAGGASPVVLTLDPGTGVKGLTQFENASTAVLRDQDGYPMGELADFGIDQNGVITGSFDNGTSMALAQVALADFNNPGGLVKLGNSVYGESPNSGGAVVAFAGEGTTSTLSSGTLEMSNVDLASEFVQMIVAQRSFAAAGRTVTTADEMTQEVLNLKR